MLPRHTAQAQSGHRVAVKHIGAASKYRIRPGQVKCAVQTSKTPELTAQEEQLLQCALNYNYTVGLPEGQLIISPLREQWLQRTGDLLADAFVDAKGIQPYRRYVRRNIGKYLEQHVTMPPAAVLVTAVLRTQVKADSSIDLGLHELQCAAPPPAASETDVAAVDSPSISSRGGDVWTGAAADEATHEQQPSASDLLTSFVSRGVNWLTQPSSAASTSSMIAPGSAAASPSSHTTQALEQAGQSTTSSSSSSKESSSSSSYHSSNENVCGDSTSSSSSSSSSSAAEAIAPDINSNQDSSSGAAGPNIASLVNSALQRISDSVALHQLRRMKDHQEYQVIETLVGVAEVSFRERTRSQAITLNPPQQCAYLCNMAVAKGHQRKGVASALLTAIEDLCLLAGESDLYLHLRLKDDATAGKLYRKHGFIEAKKDCWMVLLLGQDPRFLMIKQLVQSRTLVGNVLLPGFEQGVTAAELQQQQAQQQQVINSGAQADVQPQPAPAASPAA